ncbi:UDP-N-acetylmuramate--alanine ligase [Sphingomonas sp. MAH-20]|uniref:UDP-N-acetylmuramate--alanine ligase n=1 Tax=Sphingomonas horti TaxID=2682842 RepID=A0A6I4J4C8_9SPHN|nr:MULTISPECIES: Mur ligase family protein [Sphingomonas]MBA2919862.1 UDP-N-acetylmuramate--alanine ligase [Sphingomonas sp. CGMCC 1.13658]MVO78101.1 UDP-N-acetylmuramate--alanine ligase [Sphingomonas horti]
MTGSKSYFFCGIGGSGMLPLACIVRAQGAEVSGSDRALDQGRTAPKFDFLRAQGIDLFPQDGSGVTTHDQVLVASAAVEETVPDVQAANALGCARMSRAGLLAELFNAASERIAIGGTSGKSTVTGMIGWILHACGRAPTVMNGAVMKNFVGDDTPFASALIGSGDVFVSEVDESDGSIALFEPTVAVLGNISLDHKEMDELRALFTDFVLKARTAVVNIDHPEVAAIAGELHQDRLLTFGFEQEAQLIGHDIEERAEGVSFHATERSSGDTAEVRLQLLGRHNAVNALSAIGAAVAAGVPFAEAAEALTGFAGLRRRLERVGERNGVTVYDDFGHNPDKIAATLDALHAFAGRLLIFFQPHGYGPLRVMGRELVMTLAEKLAPDDVLILSDPVYFGGTVDRSIGSETIVEGVRAAGRNAEHIAARPAIADRLTALARPGDRIVVMGARDDTLSQFAAELVERLSGTE